MSSTPSLSISATPSLSISTTPSITTTITPSPSMVVYTKCADCSLSFSAVTSNNLIGELTVGVVQAVSGTIGDYLIEWHLNSTTGSTVFITGNSGNTDPTIQAYHPFVDELVQAGNLYPVIQYIYINGTSYSAYPTSIHGLYSPNLATCLGTITVLSMSCSNGATGSTYDHTISYVNTTMPSYVANRTLEYDLNTDGSSTEIAYEFYGYTIGDRITVSYVTNTGSTIIDDWVVGLDCTGTTYNTTPKFYKAQSLRTTISLTGFTYISGDYLLFNTYPAYNAPGNGRY